MKKIVTALFADSKRAGGAVSELKEKGFVENLSLIAKGEDTGEVTSHDLKEDVGQGALAGAGIGGALGGLFGLIAGFSSVVVPGFGTILVAGPLAVAWGLTGSALGALTGGLAGGLVDAGIPEVDAKEYERRLLAGDVLVLVKVDEGDVEKVQSIFDEHLPQESDQYMHMYAA